MAREVALHPASEIDIDVETLHRRQVQRVPVPANLEKGFACWLLERLGVECVYCEQIKSWTTLDVLCGTEATLDDLKWSDVVHARLFAEPGAGPSKKQRIEEAGSEAREARERAFMLEYKNSDNVCVLYQVLTHILQKDRYAPSAGLFQSSGWGKSRLVCELWKKHVWVVYCSFTHGSGYPDSSFIATWFRQEALKHLGSDESLRGQLMCMNFTLAYFIACIHELANGVKSMDWSHEQFLKETMKGSMYWAEVQKKITKLLEGNEFKNLTKVLASKQLTWQVWEAEADEIFKIFLPKDIMSKHNRELKILFVFDEARHLVRNERNLNCFLPIRRASRAVPNKGILVLFMDTSSEISNFSAPDWADPSDRVPGQNIMLPPPIWGTFSVDISEKDSLQLFSTPTLNSIVNPQCAVRYGRPLWWATFRSIVPHLSEGVEYFQDATEGAFNKTYRLAKDKLLGGAGAWDKYFYKGKDLPEEAALSLLGATIGLDVDPRSKLASKLVANHLLSVFSVSPTRELVWTVWSSEPLVSMAAAEAIRRLNELGKSRQLYGSLVNALAAGWIDRGYTGELVAKIILLHAINGRAPGPCTVDDFCKHLVGKSLSDLIGRALTDKEEMLANAWLHFNSFRRINKKLSDMTFDDFLKCAERSCAIQCVAGAWGVDFLIFAFTGGDNDEVTVDNTTVIYVEVKLTEKGGATNVIAAKASPHYARLSIALKLPYMSLYMNVFDKGDTARAYWVDPTEISDSVQASASKSIQIALKETEGSSKQSHVDLMDIEGDQVKKKRPAVQAWKAWLNARSEKLQTVLVVKGLEAFVLDEGLKDQLKLIVKTSRSPYFTDDCNDLHKEVLELQRSSLKEMFKMDNFFSG